MNLLQQVEHANLIKAMTDKQVPTFRPGDSVRVHVKVVEGKRTRTQAFDGVVLGRKNAGIRSTFRVRKLSHGEGVERVFQLFSPNIRVELLRKGRVRRAKLYYLRDLTGKKARIIEGAWRGPEFMAVPESLKETASDTAPSEKTAAEQKPQGAPSEAALKPADQATAPKDKAEAKPEAAEAPKEKSSDEDPS